MDEHTMLKTAKIPQLWVCKIKQKKAKNKRNCWGLLADRSNHSSLIPESQGNESVFVSENVRVSTAVGILKTPASLWGTIIWSRDGTAVQPCSNIVC